MNLVAYFNRALGPRLHRSTFKFAQSWRSMSDKAEGDDQSEEGYVIRKANRYISPPPLPYDSDGCKSLEYKRWEQYLPQTKSMPRGLILPCPRSASQVTRASNKGDGFLSCLEAVPTQGNQV